MAAFLFLASSLYAQERVIEARLRFLVWKPEPMRALLTEASQVQAVKHIQDAVTLELGADHVLLSSLRCSDAIAYQGDGVIRLLRGENSIVEFMISRNGEYYILLQPEGVGYRAFPVEISALQKGEVLVANQTTRRYSLKVAGGKRVAVGAGKSRLVERADTKNHVCHLTVHCWKELKWQPEFARHYSLVPDSKSLCVLYYDLGGERLRLQFFSGL
ncbi:hypothetical protein [Rubritalea sp.]|uniref:hypothetical protein n=1 Tax=Rubritalea sp. TaxID=2109375 RepID=UPI003EF107B6